MLTGPLLTVVRPGPLTTVQDLGRPGYAHLGVPPSGAVDPDSLRSANRKAGNLQAAAGLETTLRGVAFRLSEPRRVAVTGAVAPVTLDGEPVELPAVIPAGAVLDVGAATAGLRSYVAVAGGIDVPPVLGSRSTDRLSGLGPAPLRDGDEIPLGPDVPAPDPVWAGDWYAHSPPADDPFPREIRLLLHPGPRDDWLTPRAWELLATAAWTVTPDTDRVGVRLAGPRPDRARPGELPSEGLVTGAVQVPPDGRPVVFLADHPTTGGYPVAGVVEATGALAQARPGTIVRFVVGRHVTGWRVAG